MHTTIIVAVVLIAGAGAFIARFGNVRKHFAANMQRQAERRAQESADAASK